MHCIMQPSFDALPLSVKRCFVSFALFPEDSHVPAEHLVALWSSWELLPGKHAHDAAYRYLQMLQDASLILHSSFAENIEQTNGGFHMHDVLRDLACSMAKHKSDEFGHAVFIQVCACRHSSNRTSSFIADLHLISCSHDTVSGSVTHIICSAAYHVLTCR